METRKEIALFEAFAMAGIMGGVFLQGGLLQTRDKGVRTSRLRRNVRI
jgi:hypothetical protein